MRIQQAGEVEDERAVAQARVSNESRHMMKQFRQRHKGELNKGDDPRSPAHLVKMKKKKLISKGKKGGGKKEMEKRFERKMKMHSKPTRSKMIVKRK